MKKKLGVIITLLTLCICLMTPQMHAKAASGKTTIAVSASSLNIGQTVTVTAKALSASGDSAYANMVLTYDAGILEFVSCNATYGGGGGSISVASDSFSVTLKAISAGKASISLSATDGVIYGTEEELDSMAGSSTSVTVKNEAAGSNTGNNSSAGNNGSSGSNGNAGNGSSSGTGSNNNTGSNTAALSADNSLKALTISPGTLSPAFKGSTTKYTATVDNSVTSIAVSATPVNEKATIESVTGNTNLAVGTNVVKIVVKAENGTTATYKITVTRQDAGNSGSAAATTGGENGDSGNGDDGNDDSGDPGDTEEVDATETPVLAADVVINNTTYHIADNFTEEQIPADFTEATVNFRGAECRGLTFNKGTISLIYLETDNVDATTGRFFIYDETRDVVYDFMKFTAGESSYAIPLLAPLDSVLPESYVQVSLQMPENTVMTAYQLPVEDGEEASDFYIFYGVNQDGTEGWYQYDAAEGTYQRVNGNITETADSSSDDLAALQSEYDELSKKYKDAKSFSRNMIAVLIFVLAIAVVIILNIVLFGRKKKGKDELLEDDDSENEESEYESDEEDEFVEKSPEAPMKNAENTKKASKAGQTARTNKAGKPKKAEETEEAQEFEEDEDDYFDDEEEYIEEEHPINRAYREWNDYEDEIPSPSKKPVTEETSEKESSTENVKMDEQQKNETSIKNEKGLEVFDLNDL